MKKVGGKYYKTRYTTPHWRLISSTVAQHSVAFFVIVIREIYQDREGEVLKGKFVEERGGGGR